VGRSASSGVPALVRVEHSAFDIGGGALYSFEHGGFEHGGDVDSDIVVEVGDPAEVAFVITSLRADLSTYVSVVGSGLSLTPNANPPLAHFCRPAPLTPCRRRYTKSPEAFPIRASARASKTIDPAHTLARQWPNDR